jgi:UPF0755 protein
MKKIYVVLAILIGFLAVTFVWWQNGLAAANPKDKTPKIFIVKPGQGVREIANQLKKEGLIKDPIVFFLLTKQTGVDKKIQAGDFRLNPSMKASEVAEGLTHGTLDIWVTIPEGYRADEIADILKDKMPNYDESWRVTLRRSEGYLFPDTYLIPRDADADMVVSLLKNTFETRYASIDTSKTKLTKLEIITVASLIEREAKHAEDRPMVASVILNRYGIGMKLDIDATVQYALGYQASEKRWWKRGLTLEDLKINSPYNTYKNQGLPPGPISNPGLASLEAAVNPSSTDYLYYITDPKGINHYAETLEGHNANIEKYGTP